MSQYATATISEAQPVASAFRREASDPTQARNGSGQRMAVKGIELIPLYVWDELEPTQLQGRSEWHDPTQPGG